MGFEPLDTQPLGTARKTRRRGPGCFRSARSQQTSVENDIGAQCGICEPLENLASEESRSVCRLQARHLPRLPRFATSKNTGTTRTSVRRDAS
jgi:hypothetical protein